VMQHTLSGAGRGRQILILFFLRVVRRGGVFFSRGVGG
jgi:hypothetical protein